MTKGVTKEHTAVNDSGTGFVVLLLGAPQVLERAQGRQNGTSDPYGILPLRRRDDLDLNAGTI
jgi:hypothetical protein